SASTTCWIGRSKQPKRFLLLSARMLRCESPMRADRGSGSTRVERSVESLYKFYGMLPRPPRDPFTLFVWEVLSAHSTPRKRDAALGALKLNRLLTPDAMWRAPQKKLEASVALAGPYREQRLGAL